MPGARRRARPPSSSAPAERLVSTVLQGFYQSNQATAAACQVNNLHLLRGMLGRPGAGRPPDERPADGAEHARDRRRRRPARLPQLGQRGARPASSPSSGTSTRTSSRTGRRRRTRCRSSATPSRARSSSCGSPPPTRPSRCPTWRGSGGSSASDELFVVVQDALPDRDRRSYADVVLPARDSGARRPAPSPTSTAPSTSPRRRSSRPARRGADLDIFLDYARRMDLRDKDGGPLIKWHDPEGAFEAWKDCCAGGPATTPGISYAQLRERDGHPVALQRGGPRRHRAPLHRPALQHRPDDYCETYGHDL